MGSHFYADDTQFYLTFDSRSWEGPASAVIIIIRKTILFVLESGLIIAEYIIYIYIFNSDKRAPIVDLKETFSLSLAGFKKQLLIFIILPMQLYWQLHIKIN